jgi:hypothetical protein
MAYYQYTVKYLCGQVVDIEDILAIGRYKTAINIHNPYDFPQRPVCWKVVSPTANGQATPPGPWQPAAPPPDGGLPPDGGMEINCRLIGQFARGITGFVVIRSPNELDVVAVYTLERPDQPVVQLKLDIIAPRIIQTDREMCRD